MRNGTSDLRIPRSDALPTEPQRLYGWPRSITKFIWHTSYILLGQDEKNIFLYFFTELKTYHLSYSLIPDDFRRSVGYYLDI